MKWITEWKRRKFRHSVSPGMHVLTLGSCFAEHVADRLRSVKCPTILNPDGIIYNPVSLASSVHHWLNDEPSKSRMTIRNGLIHSMDHHGQLSAPSELSFRNNLETAYTAGRQAALRVNLTVLTFGSAWVYHWKEDGKIAANCHKLPANEFEKRLLSVDEIVKEWSDLIGRWQGINPDMQILLTVSPVRHLRDGFVENQRSKATLILAAAALEEAYDHVQYFPAYELLIDELRDYRFYADDLVHPSPTAVGYIMEAFEECLFTEELRELAVLVRKMHQDLDHRPFQPMSNEYRSHLEKCRKKLEELKASWPGLDWRAEESTLAEKWDQAIRST